MEDKRTEQLIEAILFWKGEPITLKKLTELCKVNLDELNVCLNSLEEKLSGRGIILVRKDDEVMLGTAPFASEIIEDLTREELSKELSKATLETLSIILYMSSIKRSAIDYIRGVNSQFSIRHLEMRGLIEKITSDTDSRVYLYRPTFEALSYLGVSKIEDVEGFSETKEKLDAFQRQKDEEVKVEPEEENNDLE